MSDQVWADDGSMSFLDDSHVAAGLWAVECINPNAWPATLEHLKATRADVILTQEVKKRGGDEVAAAENSARVAKWSLAIEPCRVTIRDGNSAGVAVGVRNHIGMSTPKTEATKSLSGHQGRFLVKRVGAMCRGGIHCGSIYCHHGIGIAAQANLDFLHSVAGIMGRLIGPWLIGGDWNCTPEQLIATGWLRLVKGKTFGPAANTCNGEVYDFCVVADCLAHAVVSAHTLGDTHWVPHSGVRLLIRGCSSKIKVRQLKVPKRFGPTLQIGPPNDPSIVEAWCTANDGEAQAGGILRDKGPTDGEAQADGILMEKGGLSAGSKRSCRLWPVTMKSRLRPTPAGTEEPRWFSVVPMATLPRTSVEPHPSLGRGLARLNGSLSLPTV